MVQRQAFLAGGNPARHGAIGIVAARHQRIDGRIDRARRVAATGKPAKGQVIIPGDHAHHAVFLIQIIIVHHGAGIAVAIAQEIMHSHIHGHSVGIHGAGIALAELFQRRNQARLILLFHLGFGIVKDIGVAVGIIVDVLQLYVAAAHTTHAAALFEIAAIDARRALGILRHDGRGVIIGGILIGRSLVLRIVALQLFFKVLHIKRLAVTAAAAKAQAVGLIQFAIILTVIALQEGFLHALDGQVQAPVFAVYVDFGIAAQR